jgi:hypothetical protein
MTAAPAKMKLETRFRDRFCSALMVPLRRSNTSVTMRAQG